MNQFHLPIRLDQRTSKITMEKQNIVSAVARGSNCCNSPPCLVFDVGTVLAQTSTVVTGEFPTLTTAISIVQWAMIPHSGEPIPTELFLAPCVDILQWHRSDYNELRRGQIAIHRRNFSSDHISARMLLHFCHHPIARFRWSI